MRSTGAAGGSGAPGPTAADARPNAFHVDLGAITHNVGVLRGVLPGGTRICAAVKANAYGFGLLPVARTLADAGVDALGLVDIRDAVRLREDGIGCPILLYAGSQLDERTMPRIREYDLTVTIGDDRSLAVAASFGDKAPTRVFIEVDVGLERLGAPIDTAAGLLRAAARSGAISLDGVYTHMHVPPDAEPQYLDWQFGRFQALVSAVQNGGYSTGIAMAASSPVLFRTAAMSLDAVDVGRYLYGIVRPGAEPGLAALGLRPAFGSLRSAIAHCKPVDRRDYLGAAPFTIRPGMHVGVVPMGFADGLAFLTCGAALVRGVRAPLLGGLSLEHVSLDVTGIPGVAAGDEVVFIGRQAGGEISQDEVAASQRAGLPPACLSAAVRETVPRVYHPANSRPWPAAGRRYTPFVESDNDVTTH